MTTETTATTKQAKETPVQVFVTVEYTLRGCNRTRFNMDARIAYNAETGYVLFPAETRGQLGRAIKSLMGDVIIETLSWTPKSKRDRAYILTLREAR